MIVQVCVGSSCHLKGSEKIVELLEKAVNENGLKDKITLSGSFCIGSCNRTGVTVQVDDEIYTGITPEGFDQFFNGEILSKIKTQGE